MKAADYPSIRAENERRYGTDIGRIGPMLLADRYDDRTHFIFEILQNAEDALARRQDWEGQRSVKFELTKDRLRISHFGEPFDDRDVRGICGIAETTKPLTEIGRFGIGFKSVYAFTDRPEIHSGPEDFAIESFVWPVAVPPLKGDTDETIIDLPLTTTDAHEEIAGGLRRLGPGSLLFLRQIEEIEWSVHGGASGLYLRGRPEALSENVRRIGVIGQEEGETDIEETWLVFSREVTIEDGAVVGHAEIAFSIVQEKLTAPLSMQAVSRSPLVAFFPTVVETHLGFLIQGPYRTTPSRDNVPRSDPWNQRLVLETAELLVEALRWLRNNDLLDTAALRCLPLDPTKFEETSMFRPLFEATKNALTSEPLLPRSDAGYAPAVRTRLGRTPVLRELFSPEQLASLLDDEGGLAWLSGEITRDRTPELRQYLVQELEVQEVTPETIIQHLDRPFLESQPDSWILALYEFLNGQSALRRQLYELPLIRLDNGRHVPPRADGQPEAFLPGAIATGFPTVRASVCETETAREFLRSLGLTEPDPVDDVILNVLPKYNQEGVDVSDNDYDADVRRILTAFATDSTAQREKLIVALRDTSFVKAVDAGDGSRRLLKPGHLYLATDRLKRLFDGVEGIWFVDDECSSLRGEDIRDLLQTCDAVRYLRPIEDNSLSWEEKQDIRAKAGHAATSGRNDVIKDWMLHGLSPLLDVLPELQIEKRLARTRLLWEELELLEERRGKGIFAGKYTWTHYGDYNTVFDASFVRTLNTTAWVTDADGELQRPEFVLFDTLGWKANPFLLSKIRFKPPIIETLAKEAGIEPGVLDLLKTHGLTSEVELRNRLGIEEQPETDEIAESGDVNEAIQKLLGDSAGSTPPVSCLAGREPVGVDEGGGHGGGPGRRGGEGRGSGGSGGQGLVTRAGGRGRAPGSTSGRPFVSYVGVHPDDGSDPDGLDQQTRLELEEKAVATVRAREPDLRRTPAHNPGYDLFEAGEDDQPIRWIEVKAMTGELHDRPVGMFRTQFECAREHGEAY